MPFNLSLTTDFYNNHTEMRNFSPRFYYLPHLFIAASSSFAGVQQYLFIQYFNPGSNSVSVLYLRCIPFLLPAALSLLSCLKHQLFWYLIRIKKAAERERQAVEDQAQKLIEPKDPVTGQTEAESFREKISDELRQQQQIVERLKQMQRHKESARYVIRLSQ